MSVNDEKKNIDFVQFYRSNMPEVRWLIGENPTAAKILIFFMERMDQKNVVVCSYTLLQDYFDCSRATIYRAIKVLEKNGFVGVLKIGSANAYVLNSQVAWASWNSGKRYAMMEGVVLVSHKENKDYNDALRQEKFRVVSMKTQAKNRSVLSGGRALESNGGSGKNGCEVF